MANPFDQFDSPESASANPFDRFDEAPKKQNKGIVGDTITDLKRGVEQIPGAITGLADLTNPLTYVTKTRMADKAADWVGEKTGFQPSKWQKEAEQEYSPQRKVSDEAISKAWDEGGAANIAETIATNPRSIVGVVGQSAPSMVAGGGVARLAMKGLASVGGTELAALSHAAQVEGAAGDAAREAINRMATTAGAIGEGAVTAGQNMDQVSRDVDPAKAAATSLAAGAITGLVGKFSGRVANKLGLPDVETAMAGGGLQTSSMPWYKRIPAAAAQEGLLQEFPQSAQEQIWQNLAEDRPWYEGALRQGVEGALAGGVMGGGAGVLAGRHDAKPVEQPTQTTIAGLLPAPTSTGTPSDQVLQSDVARQNAVESAQANADKIYAERDLYEETMKTVFPYGVPTITQPVASLQEQIDALNGIDQTKLKGLQRVQYQKALEKAYNEQVGITHDENGLEIPLTMGDLLNSQATVEITLREKRQQAIDYANEQAMARNDQVASEEQMQQPDPIPVVGPLSAIANHAVKTGVTAQIQAVNSNQISTQQTGDQSGTTSNETISQEKKRAKEESGVGLHVLGKQTGILENPTNGAFANANGNSDLSSAESLVKQRPDFFDSDLGRVVINHMLDVRKNPEILKSVVDLIPVDVMNMLAREKLTPEMLFNNPSVLKNSGVLSNGDNPITIPVDASAAIIRAMAIVAAKNPSFFKLSHSGGLSVDDLSANNAGVEVPVGVSGLNVSDSVLGGTTLAAKNISSSRDEGRRSSDRFAAEGTIDSKHGVTPNSDVVPGAVGGETPSAPPIIPSTVQAEAQGPQQQPAATVRGYPQGQARMLSGRRTRQGMPSEIYPHPTQPGMFAIRAAGENNAESTPAGAPNIAQGETNGQETASPAPSLTVAAAKKSKIPPNQRRDDLVGAILRVTGGNGIASSMADTLVGEKANKVGKLRGLFTNAGQQDMGDIAMLLREQEGYDVRDASHLEELIRSAASGDVAKSMARQEADAESGKEKQYRDEIRAKAKKYGIKTVAVKFSEMEKRVFETLEQRHNKALELLDAKSQERFNAALEAATAAIPESVVDEALADVSRRGLHAREFWNEATGILRGMVYDANQETSNEQTEDGNAQGDGRGDQGTGGRGNADQGDQAQPSQAAAEEVAPPLELAGQTPAEVRAQEAKRKADEEAAKREEKPKTPNVTADQVDMFNTQGGIFDQPAIVEPTASVPKTLPERVAAAKQKKADENAERAAKFAELREMRRLNSDRDVFTFERYVDGEMTELSFRRGEDVKVSGSFPMKVGKITGISQAKREIKVGGIWYDYGYINKNDYDEYAAPRAEIEKSLKGLESRIADGNTIEFRQLIEPIQKNVKHFGFDTEFDERISDLFNTHARLERFAERQREEKRVADDAARADKLRTEQENAKPAEPIKMTMAEWKATHKDAKAIIGGARTVLRPGGLVPVEIVKEDQSPSQETTAPVEQSRYATMLDIDSAISSLYDGTISLDDYKAAFRGLIENKAQIIGELGKMTKDQLLGRLGPVLAYRLKTAKKGEIVDGAFEAIRNTFALRRSFGPNSYTMSTGALARYEADKLAALSSMVEATTTEELKAFSDEISGDRNQRKEKLDAAKDPKTVEDFDNAIRLKKSEGMTFAEARMSLTPEQRGEYDRLKGIASRDQRKARADQQKTDIRVAAATTEGQIVETKHTKTGLDLFVVKAAERVEKDVYNQWDATAKRLGGWYSSFRGNGAVPGFQFKTREGADAFLKFLGGDVEQAKEIVQDRRDSFADDRSQSAVERLNEMADRLQERADESLGRDRKANTDRRARFAASAEASANAEKAMATTMRRIAEAISGGTAQFLDRVRQKAQVEYLTSVLRTAKYDELRAKYPSYVDQQRHAGEPATGETADYAEFPQYAMMRSDLANLARKMVTLPNMKMLGQRILKVADDTSAAYNTFAKDHLLEVSKFGKADGSGWANFSTLKDAERSIEVSKLAAVAVPLQIKRGEYRIVLSPSEAINRGIWQGDDKKIFLTPEVGSEIVEKLGRLNRKNGQRRGMDSPPEAPWQFENAYNNRKRLSAMGIEQPWEFRAMLREFAGLKEAPKEADKIKVMERAMVGRKNDGLDFFPTPAGTAQEMIDAAEITEGMSVLEPSAGMGHIAEQIRDVAGVDPDVIEFNGDRRELLEAKGFNVVGSDFMEADGRYDRIIMNPPFSDRRDAQHVKHAYDLLKPGGRLVSIMGEGVFFGQDKKAEAFRNWLEEVGGTSEKLPEGSFLDPSFPVNTSVNARMVVIDKPVGQAAPVETDNSIFNRANDGRIQPSDKAVYGMAAEGKSATEILKFIASASRNPFYRQLAKLLQQTGINPTIAVGDAKGWKFSAGDGKYSAAYNPATDTAALFRPAASERNVLHELMHAATLKALAKKGMASAQMRTLFEHVKKSGKLQGQYGMSNVDEFVAEAFTNPKFQQALKKVKAPSGTTGLQSAWHWFVRVVRGILGLKQGDESALSAAMELGVGVMRENMGLTNAGGEVRYASETGKVSKIDTPEFKKWFGDSKVVDAKGNPIVVYHGSPDVRGIFSEGFKAKSRGSVFFAAKDYDVANSYADDRRAFDYQNAEPQTIPLYVSIKNPMIVDANGAFWKDTERHVEEAKSAGHDGIIIKNTVDFYNNMRGKGSPTTVYAWFAPTQAKSAVDGQMRSRVDRQPIPGAVGNNGDFSPNNPDIRYNVASDWYNSTAPESVKTVVENAFKSDSSTSFVTAFNTQYHKAKAWAAEGKPWFKEVFDHGQRFLSDVSRFAVMAQNKAPTLFHEIKSIGDVKDTLTGIKSIRDLTGRNHAADIDAIASPLYEGTLAGGGSPMQGVVHSDAELRSKYKLTDRQIKLYREALSAVNVSMDEMVKSIIAKHAKNNDLTFDSSLTVPQMAAGVIRSMDKLKQENTDDDATVKRLDKTISDIKAVTAKNTALQEHGYFPLMRFGKHTVTARDAEGKVQFFGMYEGTSMLPNSGQYQANKVAGEIRADHPEWSVTTGINNTEKYKLYKGMNLEAVQLFAEHMDAESKEPFQEYLRQATNDRSVLKRLITREGTPGFDRDVRRTLAQFIVSNARSTSSSYHLYDMRKAAEAVPQEHGDIGKEAVNLYQYVSEPMEEAHALRGYLFFNFLGGSIASAMVNLTQVPLMTLPFLSQYENVGVLSKRLASAAKVAIGPIEKLSGALGDALRRAEQDGVTAPQEIHQLTATASGSSFAGNRGVTLLLKTWGTPFAMAESFNRRVTFIAAFQIAEKMTPEQLKAAGATDAFEFAENTVNETQGLYNKGNRMNIGRGAVGATLMTFKQFSIMYLELLKRMPRKQQLIMVGLMMLAAGGGGLPFVDDAEDIIDTIGQWLGYATNSRKSLRNAAEGAFGIKGADIALNGAASQMGIDLHSRFGMQNLLPGTGILKQSSINKGQDVQEFFGPAASVINSVGKTLENLATGHIGRAAMAVAPNAVSNAIKGGNMLATGYGEDTKGRRTIPVNPAEAAAKAIGFNPKSIADFNSIKSDLYQDQNMLQVKREEFTSAIAESILNNDEDARRKAMLDLKTWNDNNPNMRVTVNPSSVAQRVQAAKMEGADRFMKAVPKAMKNMARQELSK